MRTPRSLKSDSEGEDMEEEDEEEQLTLCGVGRGGRRGREGGDDDGDVEVSEYFNRALRGHKGQVALHDLSEDTWSALIFIIIKDFGRRDCSAMRCAHGVRMFFAFGAAILNVMMQGLFIYWVFKHIVRPSVQNIQNQYYDFHTECFSSDAVFNQTSWASFKHKEAICNAGFAQPHFVLGILFLWTLRMLLEIRQNTRVHRHISSIPNLPEGVEAIKQCFTREDQFGNRLYLVVGLTRLSRWAIYFLVIIPKYLIVIILTYLGWRWIVTSESSEDLILNALALVFIVEIDELIFNSVFPEMLVEKVTNLKLVEQLEEFEDKEESAAAHNADMLAAYFKGMFVMALAIGLLYVYITHLQGVIPGYNYDLYEVCRAYLHSELEHLKCYPWGNFKECFPYGPQVAPAVARLLGGISGDESNHDFDQ